MIGHFWAWLSQQIPGFLLGASNASLVAWVVLRKPDVQALVRAAVGNKVAQMELVQKQRAQKLAQIGLHLIEASRLSLPQLFDNPLFVWDDIGVLLLEAIKAADAAEPEDLEVHPELLRDEVLQALLQKDMERVKARLADECLRRKTESRRPS